METKKNFFKIIDISADNFDTDGDVHGGNHETLSGSVRLVHGLKIFTACVQVMKVAVLNGELA